MITYILMLVILLWSAYATTRWQLTKEDYEDCEKELADLKTNQGADRFRRMAE